MTKNFLILLVMVIFIWLGVFIIKDKNKKINDYDTNSIELVNNYIRKNISEISPQKEVLGGKFYITDLQISSDGKGFVEYEDGHILVKATFEYSIDKSNQIKIFNFKISPQEDLKNKDINE